MNKFKNRCWIEIDLNNLDYNLNQFKNIISNKTEIMAVLKADAYGHGAVQIAKRLIENDITHFAVSSLEEGILLRENGIQGEILVFGYTYPEYLYLISEYDLTQTIVDYKYARLINLLNLNIKGHLKINTGMNRNGINYNDVSEVIDVFHMPNITITGIYSHLSSCNTNNVDDIEHTKKQIDKFDQVLNTLKEMNIDYGLSHIQSTYGITNYSELDYDMVRLGNGLYGMKTDINDYMKIELDLKPLLSFKCRVNSIRNILHEEPIGYGRSYMAPTEMKIAALSVGFADGFPRSLSNIGMVEVNNRQHAIIGRICMDQLLIDITGNNIKQGDVVTLIGEMTPVEELANMANTITSDFLVGISKRVPVFYINNI